VSASTDAIIAKRAADARQLYQQAYASPDVSHPDIAEAMKLPAFKAAYAKGQQLATIEGTPIPKQTDPATMSVRALDYLKRGLNDVIDAGTRGGNMARGEARALNARLRTVLDAADTQAPAFAAARSSFAGHSALVDAAENGTNFLNGHVTAGDIAADLAAASPGEAQVYRTSAANSILNKIESARGSSTGKADLLSKVYDSVGGKAKLRALFPTPEAADAFETKMDRLATENATRRFVTTGSQTADKEQALKVLGGSNPVGVLATLAHAAAHPITAVSSGLQHAGDALAAQATQATATKLAPEIVSPNVSAILRRMMAEQARHAAAREAARAVAPRGANLISTLLGSYGRPGDVR